MICRILLFLCILFLFSPGRAPNAAEIIEILKTDIVAFNLKEHQASLLDGTYKGEEGPLCLTPEAARSLGLTVLVHPLYENAVALQKEAAEDLQEARRSLLTNQTEGQPDGHARAAARAAAAYNQKKSTAWNHLMTYRARLTLENDDRLKEPLVLNLLENLLRQALDTNGRNLRDSLAHVYNRCRGLKNAGDPLKPENVRFVNAVFNAFRAKAPDALQKELDLDLYRPSRDMDPLTHQATLARVQDAAPNCLRPLFELTAKEDPCVDPLLFMALMRRESSFNPSAVSYVGAAGLTQIMPATGEGLGMQTIFRPDYFDEATRLLSEERRLRRQAMDILERIKDEGDLSAARRARALMQESLAAKKKRTVLLERYRDELLEHGRDDRLDPEKAIAKGVKYFCGILKDFDGDMSLALSAYNAGPHRVRQYAGIPPYSETVTFRNRVLSFYREYIQRFRNVR
ncbi:lytic transglycosylase domain-containing protein [Desulfatiglans anilini]|uniref:lytic transglycosylase domain-containing protein n=1 Tax=Desulfatiglans anilini TaxID=90728 RepID=UPI00041A4A14|nr:transglycosylase SLT domain-containing protein [Desulfatiglans anilini]